MRLYNAQSCTPVGSSSIYIAPKNSPPRKDLPQSPTAFARNWKLQKRRSAAVTERKVTQQGSGLYSPPRRTTKVTSALFDPFEINDDFAQFPMDPFAKIGGSSSSATSATAKLTPVVSSESRDLFDTCADDDFLAFPDPFATHQIDFQNPVEGELFNDASTWMTSSTLSTKFTNHEMTNISKNFTKGSAYPNGPFVSSPSFGAVPLQSSRDFRTVNDKRPDEVFVRTPPQAELAMDTRTFPEYGSEALVASDSENQWKKEAISNFEAFDPFTMDTTTRKPIVLDKHQSPDSFDKENHQVQYLPQDYVVAKANLRSFSHNAGHKPQTSLVPKVTARSRYQKLHNKKENRSQQPDFASFPKRKPMESVRERDSAQADETKGSQVRSHLDSLLASRASISSRPNTFAHSLRPPNTKNEPNGSRQLSVSSNEERLKLAGHQPLSHHQPQSKGSVEDSAVSPSTVEFPPSSHLNGVISAAALTSGRSRLGKVSAMASSRDSKATSAGAPGSFLAERAEAVRPAAVFHPRVDASSPNSPGDRGKPSNATKNSSPLSTKVIAHGNALQDMLNRRLGKKESEQNDTAKPLDSLRARKPSAEGGKEEQKSEVVECGSNEQVALKDDPKYAKYFKMIKMQLPMGAVKNAMERDGLDPSVMDGDHSAPAGQQSGGGVPLKDDPKYAKYFKMLKTGVPMGAVKNAMERDGVDASVMDGDHSAPAGHQSSGGVPLNEDPQYAKYFKMLKAGLPMGAVKNAMERDGMDASVMDGDHAAPAGGEKGAKMGPRATKHPKDKYRRTRVHWDTHTTVRSNTVWAMVSRDPDVAGLNVDEEEFASLFQAESKPTAKQTAPTGTTEKGAVKVIDTKRANNGGITLARIKLSYEDIARAVDS